MSLVLNPINIEGSPGAFRIPSIPWGVNYYTQFGGMRLPASGPLCILGMHHNLPEPCISPADFRSTDSGCTWPVVNSQGTIVRWDEWSYYWQAGSDVITFYVNGWGDCAGVLAETSVFDLNLNTYPPVWNPYCQGPATPIGTFNPVQGNNKICKLSDGAVFLYYFIYSSPNWSLVFSRGNLAGSGNWVTETPIQILQLPGNPASNSVTQVVADSSNRMHLVFQTCDPANTSVAGGYFRYVNVTESLTFSPITVLPKNSGTGSLIAPPDGNLYLGMLQPQPSVSNTINVLVGTGLSNPTWTTEVVYDYGPSGTAGLPIYLAWLSGVLHCFWGVSHGTAYTIEHSTRISSGVWAAKDIFLDLRTFSLPANVTSMGALQGITCDIVTGATLSGFGLVVSFNTTLSDGTTGVVAYTVIDTVTCGGGPPPNSPNLACPGTSSLMVGTTYSSQLIASSGTPPYSYAITGGSLPPGLSLNSTTGFIAGVPTVVGTYSYTATVTDANGLTASVTCSIIVTPKPPPAFLPAVPCG